MYGCVDFTDKTVLDIGADWGGTPAFFLSKGARSVIGVDGNRHYVEKMRDHFKDDPRVLPLYVYVKVSQQLCDLIQIYKPDLVKVDCEGCERLLTEIPNLDLCPEYLIEVHSDEIRKTLLNLFDGYELVTETSFDEGLYMMHWRKN